MRCSTWAAPRGSCTAAGAGAAAVGAAWTALELLLQQCWQLPWQHEEVAAAAVAAVVAAVAAVAVVLVAAAAVATAAVVVAASAALAATAVVVGLPLLLLL